MKTALALRNYGGGYLVVGFVELPLETPLSALGEHVNKAVKPLFEVFNGFELGADVVEDLTRKTVERRL